MSDKCKCGREVRSARQSVGDATPQSRDQTPTDLFTFPAVLNSAGSPAQQATPSHLLAGKPPLISAGSCYSVKGTICPQV